MKVYTKIIYDKDDNVIEQHSYDYDGPVSHARKPPKYRSSKDYSNDTKFKTTSTKSNTTKTRHRTFNTAKQEVTNQVNDYKNEFDGLDGNGTTSTGTTSTETTYKRDGTMYPNVLHQFASYTTLFTLSGITENEMNNHTFLDNAPHDIIARSGGIGNPRVTGRDFNTTAAGDSDEEGSVMERTKKKSTFDSKYGDSIAILEQGHDMFIENVNMISTASPNSERNLGNFTRMEFEIHEPFGITLLEKLRAAAALNEYQDYQDAPFLLTIEFRGQDEMGQMSKVSSVRKIPILITRVEFEINEGGARYTVVSVPYSDLAYDDRFKFPRTTISINTKDPLSWAEQVAIDIDAGMQNEIDEEPPRREFKDTYEFNIHPDVIRAGQKYKNQKQTIHNTANIGGGHRGSKINTGRKEPTSESANTSASEGIALTKYFEDAIRNAYGYQLLAENFWVAYLRGAGVSENRIKTTEDITGIVRGAEIKQILLENSYVDWFKIKTTIETDTSKIDSVTKMHPKHVVYQAIPYKIHVLKLIGPGMGIKDVDFSKYVHKEYNYIYTGDNVDVQGLRINYKAAYFMRSVRNKVETNAGKGVFTHVKEAFTSVFGKERDPEPLLPLRQYPSTIRGRSTVQTEAAESNKAQEFYDYLTNPEADMMRIEMDILGDPAYICQDLYSPIHSNRVRTTGGKGKSFDIVKQSFNADQFMPMITVNYRMPSDIEELEGTSFSARNKYRSEQLFFNGIYQVNKIESKFDQGQFTQTLFCTRMNNQSGITENPTLTNSATKGTSKIKNFDVEQAAKEKIEKAKRKFKSQNFGLGAYD